MGIRKMSIVVTLTISFLLGLSGIASATGMGGMDMGSSQPPTSNPSQPNPNVGNQVMPGMQSGSVSNGQHEATPGMDPNMPGMQSGNVSNGQHEATPGMDPNMPGMQPGEMQNNSTKSGVNWPVVDGFGIMNLLVIGSAGVLKLKNRIL